MWLPQTSVADSVDSVTNHPVLLPFCVAILLFCVTPRFAAMLAVWDLSATSAGIIAWG
jgi:TRAP-type mannitol/chloroaromatic compound transport system permease small subunit